MKHPDMLAGALLVMGGLNWGLIGLFQFDLVAALSGGQSAVISRIVYSLLGLSTVYQAISPEFDTVQMGCKAGGLTDA